jgi:hypothetical protein
MNKYVITFLTKDEIEVGLVLEIEVTVNRPNNPDDETIIMDYLDMNYGNTVDYDTLQWHVLTDVVKISEDYSVEV